MMNVEAFGMDLGQLPDGVVPLGAVVAIKTIRPDGQVSYDVRATPDLPMVEALGMSHHMTLLLEQAILNPVEGTYGAEDTGTDPGVPGGSPPPAGPA